MRLRAFTLTAAAVVVAGLSLTACGPDSGDDAAGTGGASSSSSPSGAPGDGGTSSAPGTGTGTGTGASASASKGATTGGAGGGGTAGGPVGACTAKTTKVRFIASSRHASEQEPAAATVKVTNVSGKTCTIVGASVLTAEDDQGKADPIETDNHEGGTDGVDVKPGAAVTATVLYSDLNAEGSQSGREVCAVQASKVEVALPKDVSRTVRVTKADGAPGIFSVCTPDVKFEGFHA